jgi:hypothetical protein
MHFTYLDSHSQVTRKWGRTFSGTNSNNDIVKAMTVKKLTGKLLMNLRLLISAGL